MIIELKAKCPHCQTVRTLWGPLKYNTNADAVAAETLIDIKGKAIAKCPECNHVELVALFADDAQTEEWMDADKYEKLNGKDAGTLPPMPDLGD